MVELEDRVVELNKINKIPNQLFQTWETKFVGKTHFKSLQDFRKLNPNISFYIYDKKRRDAYMEEFWNNKKIFNIYKKSIFGPMKADIFRYCILYERGGYYFDIGKSCNLPITKLHHKNQDGFFTYEDNTCFFPPNNHEVFNLKRPFNYLLQWGLGFSKKNFFLQMLINAIEENYVFYKKRIFESPKDAILNFTGPGMFTRVFRDYISKNPDHNLNELDIKFNHNGNFKVKGASVRHYQIPSYTYIKSSIICN